MKFLTSMVFALAASSTSAKLLGGDACRQHVDAKACVADLTTGGGCTWCSSDVADASCWTAAYAAQLPEGALTCDFVDSVTVENEPCLTPEQEKQLKEAIFGIKTTLNTADASLLIAAAAEKNETIKKDLLLAEKIISAVNVEIVNNLTKIANEACGNCSQILKTVNDSLTSLEDALEKIEPDWKTNPIFKAIVAAVDSIVNIVAAFCPSSVATYFPL